LAYQGIRNSSIKEVVEEGKRHLGEKILMDINYLSVCFRVRVTIRLQIEGEYIALSLSPSGFWDWLSFF
jgi:hypothetical protein